MSVNKNILFLISNIRDYIDRLETLIKWTDPNIPDLSEEMCRKMEARETLDEMYIHDWLIFPDNPLGCRIAIHKDVVNPSKASHADCSSPDPDDDISRFGPGTCAMSLQAIDDLHMDVNHVYTLVDEGYIDGKKAHLIFKQSSNMVPLASLLQAMKYVDAYMVDHVCTDEVCDDCETEQQLMDAIGGAA